MDALGYTLRASFKKRSYEFKQHLVISIQVHFFVKTNSNKDVWCSIFGVSELLSSPLNCKNTSVLWRALEDETFETEEMVGLCLPPQNIYLCIFGG